jgi:hypothetical protein
MLILRNPRVDRIYNSIRTKAPETKPRCLSIVQVYIYTAKQFRTRNIQTITRSYCRRKGHRCGII